MAKNPRGKHGRILYDLKADFGVDPDELRKSLRLLLRALPHRDRDPMKQVNVHGPGDVRIDEIAEPEARTARRGDSRLRLRHLRERSPLRAPRRPRRALAAADAARSRALGRRRGGGGGGLEPRSR